MIHILIVIFGDSLTFGTGLSNIATQGLKAQLEALVPDATFTIAVCGYPNNIVSGVMSNYETDVAPLFDADNVANIIVFENINSHRTLTPSSDPADIAATYTDSAIAMKADKDWTIGITTLTPSNGADEIIRENVNEILSAAPEFDFVVPLGDSVVAGHSNTIANGDLYQNDGIHYAALMYVIWAHYILRAIRNIPGLPVVANYLLYKTLYAYGETVRLVNSTIGATSQTYSINGNVVSTEDEPELDTNDYVIDDNLLLLTASGDGEIDMFSETFEVTGIAGPENVVFGETAQFTSSLDDGRFSLKTSGGGVIDEGGTLNAEAVSEEGTETIFVQEDFFADFDNYQQRASGDTEKMTGAANEYITGETGIVEGDSVEIDVGAANGQFILVYLATFAGGFTFNFQTGAIAPTGSSNIGAATLAIGANKIFRFHLREITDDGMEIDVFERTGDGAETLVETLTGDGDFTGLTWTVSRNDLSAIGTVFKRPLVITGDAARQTFFERTINYVAEIPDTIDPVGAVIAPTPGQQIGTSFLLRASASDDSAVASVQFKIDGELVGEPITSPTGGAYEYQATLAEGIREISAVVTDGGGNEIETAAVGCTVVKKIGWQNLLLHVDTSVSSTGVIDVTDNAPGVAVATGETVKLRWDINEQAIEEIYVDSLLNPTKPAPGANQRDFVLAKREADGSAWFYDPFTKIGGGETEIADGSVTNAKVATGLDAAKIADGSVSNAEFQYLNGASSNLQTQITGALSRLTAIETPAVNEQVGTSYTLQASDKGKVVRLSNAAAIALTVPSGLGAGFSCLIVQGGAGQVTVSGSGATVNNRQSHTKIAGQHGSASLFAYAANTFLFSGDTAA